jgi:hypothetical protein
MNDDRLIDQAIDALREKVSADARAAAQEAARADLEQDLLGVLKHDIAAEAEARKASPALNAVHQVEFVKLKRYAIENGLPPTSPELVAAYVIKRSSEGAELELVVDTVSTVCKLAGLPDPMNDILPVAAVRFVKRNLAEEPKQLH